MTRRGVEPNGTRLVSSVEQSPPVVEEKETECVGVADTCECDGNWSRVPAASRIAASVTVGASTSEAAVALNPGSVATRTRPSTGSGSSNHRSPDPLGVGGVPARVEL